MLPYHHILVGIDFSPASLSATWAAVRLASRHGTPITVVHVVDPQQISGAQKRREMSESDFLGNAVDQVHRFLEQAGPITSPTTVEVEVGPPLLKLTEACSRHRSDLLVLGARGAKRGPHRIGTVAAKCLRKAPADILLVPARSDTRFKRISACVDFSENSANVVRSAMSIADNNDAELDCVFVVRGSVDPRISYGGILPTVAAPNGESLQRLKEDLKRFLKPLVAGSRLAPTSHVLGGASIRERIFEHARESKADLVVLGTHGETGLHTFLMGTAAESIVTHAPCAVLGVKPASVALTKVAGSVQHS
jgi:nucleotide-binding universal stress UspA family protein